MRGYLMRRLGIFLFNNSNGLVDDYIHYLLNDITLNLNHLCIIINNDDGTEDILKKYTEDIYINNNCYENIDIWKEVIVNYVGFDKLMNFDEIILFDDSFFGPIYSFKDIFAKVNNVDLDLWTIFSNNVNDELNSFNIQFIAFRNNLIKSNDFKDFWVNINSYFIKNNHENYIINHFSKLGYLWKNYLEIINMFKFDSEEPFFCIFDIYNLIKDYKFPLINIKPFTLSKIIHLKYHNGLDLSLTMNYLNRKTDYNVSLIYEYLLKIVDPNDLVNLLNLKKIIPTENLNYNYKSEKSIAVIAHLYYDDLLDYDFKFLSNIPEYIDIIITTDDINKKMLIENQFLSKIQNKSQVILVNSRGRDMSGLFVGCKNIINNYDYFCFIHDKKSSYSNYYLIGYSFRDIIWENMLASEDYINSIIKLFDNNERLGLIVPPRVYHSTIFTNFYNRYWLKNVRCLKKLFDEMDINIVLDLNELPLSIGNCYWAKFDALKPLFDLDWDYDDFHPEPMPLDGTISHALERVYGHVAASQGFYTEIVMNEYYGSNELTNFPYMFSELLMVIRNRYDKLLTSNVTFNEFLNKFNNKLLNMNKIINEKDKKLNDIMNSNSWKITKHFRMISFKLTKFKNKLIK